MIYVCLKLLTISNCITFNSVSIVKIFTHEEVNPLSPDVKPKRKLEIGVS